MSAPTERRICWPEPDATCLEGGCIHCDGHPFRKLSVIERYAARAGQLPNRYGDETQDAMRAHAYGLKHRWCNRVEYR